MNRVSIDIVNDPIDLSLFLSLDLPDHGARTLFLGTVRNQNNGKSVIGLSYDVFRPLALKRMAELCETATLKWGPDLSIWIRQRVGSLKVGEVGIAIGVSSPHRAEAYEASRSLIEGIKHTVPLWKKEFYESGESDWLEGHSLCNP